MNILIYVRGSAREGMGHVQREITLAKELITRGHSIEFLTQKDTPAEVRIRESFYAPSIVAPSIVAVKTINRDIPRYLEKCISDTIILDLEGGPTRTELLRAKSDGRRVIVIGGVGQSMRNQRAIDELVDLQIYQSIAVNDPKTPLASNILVGAEYAIIGREYLEARREYVNIDSANSAVLISMGGSDPHYLTSTICNALHLSNPNLYLTAVAGPAFSSSAYSRLIQDTRANLTLSPKSLANEMVRHRYLVAALGMTVYEACCIGIPSVCTAWTKDHEATAHKLQQRGVLRYAGLWDRLSYTSIVDFIHMPQESWTEMYHRGRELIDGRGVERVAEAIEAL